MWILAFVVMIYVFIAGGIYGGVSVERQRKCTTEQLHEVIEKVESCTKSKVICSSDDKDKILREFCK